MVLEGHDQIQEFKQLLRQVCCHLQVSITLMWTNTLTAILDSDGQCELHVMLCHAALFKEIIHVRPSVGRV
jgi:hypothetical protein